MQILTTLQAGQGCTVRDLSRMFGTSRRTIFRDLKELQAMGIPYHYDPATGRYRMEPEYFLPPADLNLQEALALLLLAQKVSNQVQLPFQKSARLAALKIESNLPVWIKKYCSNILEHTWTRREDQAFIRHSNRFDKIFLKLQEAIAKKRIVSLSYYSPLDGQVIDIEFCPYHLLYENGMWYILGRSNPHNGIRTFELNRLKDLTLMKKCFLDDEDFDVSEYLRRAWSTLPEGHIYHVKLLFLPKVANNVAEVTWHHSQKVTYHKDGSALIEFQVDGLNEITWWVLRYGDQVQVLSPKSLRKRIREIAENVVKINESDHQPV
jgi:predicted DNA-binding transcriptional regulator YafY